MEILKNKKANGKFVGLDSVKQTTGTSESDLMSQKAVTDAIDETKMVTDTRMTTAESEIDTLQSTVAGIETLLAAI